MRCSLLSIAALVTACSLDRPTGPGPRAPSIASVAARQNYYNALSIIVTFRVLGADSARVIYWTAGEPERATPFSETRDGERQLAVLDLLVSTPYLIAIEASNSNLRTRSPSLQVSTGELPEAIRSLKLSVSGTSPEGYTLVVPLIGGSTPAAFIIAFDGTGRLCWYRSFPDEGWAVEAKQQRNGDFTAYIGRSYGWQPTSGRFVEFLPRGEVVRSFRVSAPSFVDPHELLLSFADTQLTAVHLMSYEIRLVDLRPIGGPEAAPMAMHSIVRLGPDGSREFVWNAADHFSVRDWPTPNPNALDLVHPSSLALDNDGNYVISLQAMDEIMKIDGRTGAMLWRFGGRNNQFTILDDPLDGFRGQHSVRILENGNLLLFDNHTRSYPVTSRAVEYALNPQSRTARLVWQYAPDPPIASEIMGSVQRLGSGNTLVAFGLAGHIAEVDPASRVVWSADLTANSLGTPVQLYRAIRIGSLYRYQTP